MEAAQIKEKVKKDFDNAVATMSIIPVLTLVYIIVGKMASISILTGDVGYMMLVLVMIMLLGIVSGRRIIWYMIAKIIDMQKELVEKQRLATISETVLSLGHEIVNPLFIVKGNLDLLSGEITKGDVPNASKDRLHLMKANCERISDVMDKMMRISKPVSTTIADKAKMIDLQKSVFKDKAKAK